VRNCRREVRKWRASVGGSAEAHINLFCKTRVVQIMSASKVNTNRSVLKRANGGVLYNRFTAMTFAVYD